MELQSMANLTTRELSMIQDQLKQEKLLIVKYQSYSKICSDPQLKAKCEQFAGKHQAHYDTLLACLG